MAQKGTRPTDVMGIVATVDPVSSGAAQNSDWFAVADFEKFAAILMSGGTNGGLNAKIEQATSAAGAGAKDVTGKAITASSTTDAQFVIELSGEDLDAENNFTHARLAVTPGGTTLMGAMVVGMNPRYGPASDRDLASVEEIIGLDA